MNRRRFLAAAAAAGGAALAAEGLVLEPRRLEVTRHGLPLRLPAGSPAFTAVQISDLHLRRVGRIHERIALAVRDARPDVVLHTGDAVDRAGALPLLEEFLALLPREVPSFAILGNWEHWSGVAPERLREVYARAGVRLLVNQSVLHPHGHGAVRVTGLDDHLAGRPDLSAALRGVPAGAPHLLLCHCPVQRDALPGMARAVEAAGVRARAGVDPAHLENAVVLAGHTHGGQVALGRLAPVVPPASGRYLRGWYRDPGLPPLYVSRGVGTSMLPVRLGSVPEVTVLEALIRLA